MSSMQIFFFKNKKGLSSDVIYANEALYAKEAAEL